MSIFTRRYSQHSLEKLSWRVCDDREGGNQVEEQHDLHQDLHPAGRHGQHDVVLYEVTEREITTSGNRDVKKEQNWQEVSILSEYQRKVETKGLQFGIELLL